MSGERFGDYEVISELGRGAMGVVKLARTPQGREVALKLILDERLDEEMRVRFLREAKIALTVDHPNVVRAFAAGELDGELFMVCELVRGGSLAERLEHGALAEAGGLYVLHGVLGALAAIDRARLIHRDVKPANILLDGPTVKLSDLGLARRTTDDATVFTRTGRFLGTPLYAAPEQIMGSREIDIRCDLYAAGVTLFQCLTSRPPFIGRSATEVIKKHLEAPVPDVRDLVPEIREEVAELIFDLMAKDPDARPTHPADAIARVEELLGAGATRPGADPSALVTLAAPPPGAAPADPASTLSGPTIGAAAPTRRLVPTADPSSALDRARIRVGAGPAAPTLFVYAGVRLQLGRNAIDREPEQDVCLRLRPAAGDEDATRRISGAHLRLTIEDGAARVVDLGSSGGTQLDGRRLAAKRPEPLPPTARLGVAGVIELDVARLSAPPPLPITIDGLGEVAPTPGIHVGRPVNGTEHAYALVPGTARFDLDEDGALRPSSAADPDLEVLAAGGRLCLRVPGIAPEACVPIADGLSFGVRGRQIEVGAIRAADQK